jgi:predicted MFS family arabinose efflux permease
MPRTATRTEEATSNPAGTSAPPGWLILLLAVSCGLTAANLYYAQPLLAGLSQSFHVDEVAAGALITVTQVGYAAGMVLLVPLGDRIENRRLISTLLAITTAGLVAVGVAPDFPLLLAAALAVGATSVVAQILVPFAADLAPDHVRGRIVGRVMSGLIAGILLSRTLGSFLAQATSWRVVYLVSAGFMAFLALALRYALPTRAPTTRIPYGSLLRSMAALLRIHPELRRRALYQSAMFSAFSAFWTTISYVLTGPPFHYSHVGVGVFALVGAGGAAVAPLAGHWADRGLGRTMTAVAFGVAALAFALAGLGRHNVILLGLAAILVDMAVQTTMILGQHTVYRLDPSARARLNSAFVAFFFLGGALGSQLGSIAYHSGGWTALTVFGAALPVLGLLFWATERGAADPGNRRA